MAKQAKPDFKLISRGMTSFDRQMYENTPEQESTPALTPEESEEDKLIPFATRLPKSMITRLKQHQYWDREAIMDTVINALGNYLDNFEGSNNPLPPEILKKASRGRKRK